MIKRNNIWITERARGWAVKGELAERAVRILRTQHQAVEFARKLLRKNEGGELVIRGTNNQIISKDTIGKNDPYPPKDLEN